MVSLSFSGAQQLVRLQVLIWNYFHVPGVKPRSSVSSKEEISEDDHHRCNKNTTETKVFSQSLAAAIAYSPVCICVCVCVCVCVLWWHKHPLCFSKVPCSLLKHFPTNPHSLLQIPSILTCYRCEAFGAFSSLLFFSPLELTKKPWAEVGGRGQCCIWSSWFLQATLSWQPLAALQSNPCTFFCREELVVQALTLEARKTISCSFSWSPNELNSCCYSPNEGGCEGFSHQVSAAHYQIWKRQIIKDIIAKSLPEKVLLCSPSDFFGGSTLKKGKTWVCQPQENKTNPSHWVSSQPHLFKWFLSICASKSTDSHKPAGTSHTFQQPSHNCHDGTW